MPHPPTPRVSPSPVALTPAAHAGRWSLPLPLTRTLAELTEETGRQKSGICAGSGNPCSLIRVATAVLRPEKRTSREVRLPTS